MLRDLGLPLSIAARDLAGGRTGPRRFCEVTLL